MLCFANGVRTPATMATRSFDMVLSRWSVGPGPTRFGFASGVELLAHDATCQEELGDDAGDHSRIANDEGEWE